MRLPPELIRVMDTLEAAGHRVYCVGGCVRDSLLGKEAFDYDLASSARPEAVLALFGEKAHPTGIQHGTVTVTEGKLAFEITAFRRDGNYPDGRHPERVDFVTDIREDLARRDFTVNAMAYHPREGRIDPFGGEKDLEMGLLRTVGEAALRFREDGLRILRALRFAATLDFRIEADCALALHREAALLGRIARERIGAEFLKLLAGPGAERLLLQYPEIYALCLPMGGDPRGLSKIPLEGRLAFLLLSSADVEESVQSTAEALRLRKEESRRLRLLLTLQSFELTEESLLFFLQKAEIEEVRLGLCLRKAAGEESSALERAFAFLLALEEEKRPFRLQALRLKSERLLSLGIRGKDLGKLRERLLLAAARGDVENEEEALLAYAKLFVKDNFNEEL